MAVADSWPNLERIHFDFFPANSAVLMDEDFILTFKALLASGCWSKVKFAVLYLTKVISNVFLLFLSSCVTWGLPELFHTLFLRSFCLPSAVSWRVSISIIALITTWRKSSSAANWNRWLSIRVANCWWNPVVFQSIVALHRRSSPVSRS